MRIKKSKLKLFIDTILMVFGAFLYLSDKYIVNYAWIQRGVILFLFFMLAPYLKVLCKKRYLLVNLILLFVMSSAIISGWINRDGYAHSFTVGLTFAVQVFLATWYIESVIERGMLHIGINYFFRIVFIICLLSDIVMIVAPYRISHSWGEFSYYYLIGNKFDISYLHIILLFLYTLKNWMFYGKIYKNKKNFIVLMIIALAVSIYTECATAIVGLLVFLVVLLVDIFKPKGMLCSIIYLGLCNILLIVNYSIINTSVIRYVIENILHESVELTGRQGIYLKYLKIFTINPIFGAGLDNNYALSMEFTGAADMQNGMLDIYLSYGIVGAILFIILYCLTIYSIQKLNSKISQSFFAIIIMFVTLSAIEITFRIQMYIILLFSWCICMALKEDIDYGGI